jgi:hypothetical protein
VEDPVRRLRAFNLLVSCKPINALKEGLVYRLKLHFLIGIICTFHPALPVVHTIEPGLRSDRAVEWAATNSRFGADVGREEAGDCLAVMRLPPPPGGFRKATHPALEGEAVAPPHPGVLDALLCGLEALFLPGG